MDKLPNERSMEDAQTRILWSPTLHACQFHLFDELHRLQNHCHGHASPAKLPDFTACGHMGWPTHCLNLHCDQHSTPSASLPYSTLLVLAHHRSCCQDFARQEASHCFQGRVSDVLSYKRISTAWSQQKKLSWLLIAHSWLLTCLWDKHDFKDNSINAKTRLERTCSFKK